MYSSAIKLGENRGAPRIYLGGKWLKKAGFCPGDNFLVKSQPGKLDIYYAPTNGTRKVSGKTKAGESIPIIDIAGAFLKDVFSATTNLKLVAYIGHIEITAKEERCD
jgi:hypothetical protein